MDVLPNTSRVQSEQLLDFHCKARFVIHNFYSSTVKRRTQNLRHSCSWEPSLGDIQSNALTTRPPCPCNSKLCLRKEPPNQQVLHCSLDSKSSCPIKRQSDLLWQRNWRFKRVYKPFSITQIIRIHESQQQRNEEHPFKFGKKSSKMDDFQFRSQV